MYDHVAKLIHKLIIARARIIYSDHAERERMPERDITEDDVEAALSECRITERRENELGEVWAAEGEDLDERTLRIPVAIRQRDNAIIIVSTIVIGSGGT